MKKLMPPITVEVIPEGEISKTPYKDEMFFFKSNLEKSFPIIKASIEAESSDSGLPAISFIIEVDDGKLVYCKTTARLLYNIAMIAEAVANSTGGTLK